MLCGTPRMPEEAQFQELESDVLASAASCRLNAGLRPNISHIVLYINWIIIVLFGLLMLLLLLLLL